LSEVKGKQSNEMTEWGLRVSQRRAHRYSFCKKALTTSREKKRPPKREKSPRKERVNPSIDCIGIRTKIKIKTIPL